MLIILILLVLTAFGIFIFKSSDSIWDDRDFIGIMISVLSGFALVICLIVIGLNHVQVDAQHEALLTQQNAIEYKINSGIYQDEFGLLDKDVVNETMNWNKNIISRKACQRDPWIGMFIPNIYDDLKLIEYDSIQPKQKSNNF